MDGTERSFRAYFRTVAAPGVPSAQGRFLEFQEATLRFAVINESAVVHETQLLVLSTPDLRHRILIQITQLKKDL